MRSLLAYPGNPLLQVSADPLRVERTTPEDLPSRRVVRVGPDACASHADVRVVATARSFAIFRQDHALALATLLEAETVHLKLDLRPLGIKIYDDLDGLHVGTNVFFGNEVRRAAGAINLGD